MYKIKDSAFKYLITKNSALEKTKEVQFEELQTSAYLVDNRNTTLSKIIFSIRSKTFDIKSWQPWKYFDNLCVACEIKEESIHHFLTCTSYENVACEENWKTILNNEIDKQFEIAQIAKQRQRIRKQIIDKYEVGHPQVPSGSRAPGNC